MSDFLSTLFTHLSTNVGLSTLIGTRLYPGAAEDDATLPFIVYYEFANPREHGFAGVAVNKPRIQYTIYGVDYDDCLAVAEALRTALLLFNSPLIFEDERAYHDITSNLYRRDVDVRLPHV